MHWYRIHWCTSIHVSGSTKRRVWGAMRRRWSDRSVSSIARKPAYLCNQPSMTSTAGVTLFNLFESELISLFATRSQRKLPQPSSSVQRFFSGLVCRPGSLCSQHRTGWRSSTCGKLWWPTWKERGHLPSTWLSRWQVLMLKTSRQCCVEVQNSWLIATSGKLKNNINWSVYWSQLLAVSRHDHVRISPLWSSLFFAGFNL